MSHNLLVATSERPNGTVFLNRVKVPNGVGVPRFLKVGNKYLYITFEELIAHNLDELFPGLHIHSCEFFRVTRNAITDRMEDEQANDLLVMIESALRDRKFADIVRLQVSRDFIPHHRGMLAAELGIDEQDSKRYLSIIEQRVEKNRTGSEWQLNFLNAHQDDRTLLTLNYLKNQMSGKPVHQWDFETTT